MAEQRSEEEFPGEPQWTLGDRLAKARRHAGLEQGEMAEKLGVSRAAVSAWENDHNKPNRGEWDLLSLTARWAELTGVRLEWLRSRCLSGLPSPPLPHQQSFPELPTLEIATSA